jgi:hypothetical protein
MRGEYNSEDMQKNSYLIVVHDEKLKMETDRKNKRGFDRSSRILRNCILHQNKHKMLSSNLYTPLPHVPLVVLCECSPCVVLP